MVKMSWIYNILIIILSIKQLCWIITLCGLTFKINSPYFLHVIVFLYGQNLWLFFLVSSKTDRIVFSCWCKASGDSHIRFPLIRKNRSTRKNFHGGGRGTRSPLQKSNESSWWMLDGASSTWTLYIETTVVSGSSGGSSSSDMQE